MTIPDALDQTDATRAATSDEPLPSVIAGRYLIHALLGRGGFGAVYKAYDSLEERWVALKLIRNDASLDPRATGTRSSREVPPSTRSPRSSTALRSSAPASRSSAMRLRKSTITRSFGTSNAASVNNLTEAFKDEFRLLTQLHHPNLAAVYDYGRCDEVSGVYFTQELLDGESLSEFLKGAPRETVVELFVQLARALDYIHTLGLVHEDIKPSNVVVCPPESASGQPQAKLIDFGLARMLRGPGALNPELDDPDAIMVLGTPGFSAPEKVRGQLTDSRSDIYSLAATLYAATRGKRPFPAANFRDALRGQRDWRPELAGALPDPARAADLWPDSVSLRRLLRQPKRSVRKTVYGEANDREFFVRSRSYKLRLVLDAEGWTEELYNLKRDPEERYPVRLEEPRNRAAREELRTELRALFGEEHPALAAGDREAESETPPQLPEEP